MDKVAFWYGVTGTAVGAYVVVRLVLVSVGLFIPEFAEGIALAVCGVFGVTGAAALSAATGGGK